MPSNQVKEKNKKLKKVNFSEMNLRKSIANTSRIKPQ